MPNPIAPPPQRLDFLDGDKVSKSWGQWLNNVHEAVSSLPLGYVAHQLRFQGNGAATPTVFRGTPINFVSISRFAQGKYDVYIAEGTLRGKLLSEHASIIASAPPRAVNTRHEAGVAFPVAGDPTRYRITVYDHTNTLVDPTSDTDVDILFLLPY